MSSSRSPRFSNVSPVLVLLAFSGLASMATVSQADTVEPGVEAALPAEIAAQTEVSFWVDAAPLTLLIKQLAYLSGRSAEIEGLEPVPVSGRFSTTLDKALAELSANYPVIFDLNDKTLHAMHGDAQSSVSRAMLSASLNDTVKKELLASAGFGNTVEFREDTVRISGHPAFVTRLSSNISEALASAEAKVKADALATETEAVPASTEVTTIADSGSAEVLVDIQDESKPPADQANLSQPIRWVTDIPGFHTF